jgi:hypothetical protein
VREAEGWSEGVVEGGVRGWARGKGQGERSPLTVLKFLSVKVLLAPMSDAPRVGFGDAIRGEGCVPSLMDNSIHSRGRGRSTMKWRLIFCHIRLRGRTALW